MQFPALLGEAMVTLTGAFLGLLVLALLERSQISRLWKRVEAVERAAWVHRLEELCR